jgi:hypothetical protein
MRKVAITLVAAATATLVGVAPPVANAAGSAAAPQTVHAFPSASSTVVGSVGFIDSQQVGYFWSQSRGDSVAEAFQGPNSIKKAILKLEVIENALNSGNEVDWTLSINGKDVGSFVVSEGQLGPFKKKFKFKKITGGTYDVKMRVTNEVPGGGGSHTFRYAGAGSHSITLKKK